MVLPSSPLWFDFIVIGAGTAGAVLACRLSADPSLRIALIEAGGEARDPAIADPLKWPALQGSAVDWGYGTVPQAHTANRVHAWPRGRVMGGSSAINAMAHVRGHSSDFDAWAAAGCAGWSYLDLLPYFIRSERSQYGPSPYHGDAGPLRLIRPPDPHALTTAYMDAGVEIGLAAIEEHNGAEIAGPTVNTLSIVDGKRLTAADAYLTAEVRRRSNLTILSNTAVESLVLEAGPVCRGVTIDRDGAREKLLAERGVVLAAGAIGSPLLLLRSGIGPADELAAAGVTPLHDLPGVGRNLHDHLLSGGNVYRARRPVPPSRHQHSESLTYVHGSAGGAAPDLVLACVIAPVVTEMFTAPPAGSAYTIMCGFTHPRSRGSIRLASADPCASPLIDPNYLAEEADRAAYLEALDLAQRVGAARALADWRENEILPGADISTRKERLQFLAKAAYTHHHPVGTCRMGRGADAVVDPGLGLRGVDGLYVMDASVIPRITTGPVNAAIVAMAERASDLLAGRAVLAPARPPRDPHRSSEGTI
jgi:choline dehydrogenase-like flavoprotein